MVRKKVFREAVNLNQTVDFHRTLYEVPTRDGMNLIMTRKAPVRGKPLAPVVLVHGLGQNRYSWTLTKRSMENYLVRKGFETFNVELRGHGLSRANGSDYPERFETYLYQDIPAVLRRVREVTGTEKMFYIGHSLGGTISYCIGFQLHDYLCGIVSIAGPFNFAKGNPFMRLLAKGGFSLGKTARIRSLHPEAFYVDLAGFLARFGLFLMDNRFNRFPIQLWYPGSMEDEVLTERIEKGVDRTSFNVFWLLVELAASGRLHGSGRKENFEDRISRLEAPILFVVGDRDSGVPEASVQEAFDKAGTRDKTLKVFGGEAPGLHWGHCDLICGREAPRIVWPYILKWMQTRLPSS